MYGINCVNICDSDIYTCNLIIINFCIFKGIVFLTKYLQIFDILTACVSISNITHIFWHSCSFYLSNDSNDGKIEWNWAN